MSFVRSNERDDSDLRSGNFSLIETVGVFQMICERCFSNGMQTCEIIENIGGKVTVLAFGEI
jgi:hypothetical protein